MTCLPLPCSAVNIGFTGVSGSLPNLVIEVALLKGRLKQGFEIEVSLNLGHLGNGEKIHHSPTEA